MKPLKDVRCVCKFHPVLAKYGISKEGEPYIHVKVFKGGRIYGEFIVLGGLLKLKCRDCTRWMNISIHPADESFTLEDAKPSELTRNAIS